MSGKVEISVEVDLPDEHIKKLQNNIQESDEDNIETKAGFELLEPMVYSSNAEAIIKSEEIVISTKINEGESKEE